VKILEKEMFSHINTSTQLILEEFTSMKRKDNPFWGK
jgi:translation initiation factor 5B